MIKQHFISHWAISYFHVLPAKKSRGTGRNTCRILVPKPLPASRRIIIIQRATMSVHFNYLKSLNQLFSTGGDLSPRGQSVMSGDVVGRRDWGLLRVGENRQAAKHPAMNGTLPKQRLAGPQNVLSATLRDPALNESKPNCYF